jgi:hypothetical protein
VTTEQTNFRVRPRPKPKPAEPSNVGAKSLPELQSAVVADDLGELSPEPTEWSERLINMPAFCKGCQKPFAQYSWAKVYKAEDGRWMRYHEECWPWNNTRSADSDFK